MELIKRSDCDKDLNSVSVISTLFVAHNAWRLSRKSVSAYAETAWIAHKPGKNRDIKYCN